MKVWVDCTAAAHPLVLRPIIERLEAQGNEVFDHRPRIRADGRHPRPARDALHGGRRARRGLDAGQGAGARVALARADQAGLGAAAGTGARPRLGRPRGRLLRCCRIPSVQMQDYEFAEPAAEDRLPQSPPGAGRRSRSRSTGCAKVGATPKKLVRFPGLKEDYYLADFVPDPAGSSTTLGLDRDAR